MCRYLNLKAPVCPVSVNGTTNPKSLNQRPGCAVASLCPTPNLPFKSVHLTTEELSNPASLLNQDSQGDPSSELRSRALPAGRRAATGTQRHSVRFLRGGVVFPAVWGPLPTSPPQPNKQHSLHAATAFTALAPWKRYTTAFTVQTLRKVCYFLCISETWVFMIVKSHLTFKMNSKWRITANK